MTHNTEQQTPTTGKSKINTIVVPAAILAFVAGAWFFVNHDVQKQAAKTQASAQNGQAQIEDAAAEFEAEAAPVLHASAPTAGPEAFANKASAFGLANIVMARSTNQSLELQGNTVMPSQEVLDIVGRAVGLGPDLSNTCGIKLTNLATETDYKMALAMSEHFVGKICVPASAKVQNGKTLLEQYLEGKYTPMNVHVMGLKPRMALQDPELIRQAEMEPLLRALARKSVHPAFEQAADQEANLP